MHWVSVRLKQNIGVRYMYKYTKYYNAVQQNMQYSIIQFIPYYKATDQKYKLHCMHISVKYNSTTFDRNF